MARDYRLSIRLSDEEAELLSRVCQENSTNARHLLMAGVLKYQNVGQVTPNGVEVTPKGVNRPTFSPSPSPSAPVSPSPSAPTPPPTTTPITPPTTTPPLFAGARAGGSVKRRRKANPHELSDTQLSRLERWLKAYHQYGKTGNYALVERRWKEIDPDDDRTAWLIAQVERQAAEREASRAVGEWLPEWPLAATWLDGRWKDDYSPPTKAAPSPVEGPKEPIQSLGHFVMLRLRGHLGHYDADSVAKFETQARASPQEVAALETQLGGGVPQGGNA